MIQVFASWINYGFLFNKHRFCWWLLHMSNSLLSAPVGFSLIVSCSLTHTIHAPIFIFHFYFFSRRRLYQCIFLGITRATWRAIPVEARKEDITSVYCVEIGSGKNRRDQTEGLWGERERGGRRDGDHDKVFIRYYQQTQQKLFLRSKILWGIIPIRQKHSFFIAPSGVMRFDNLIWSQTKAQNFLFIIAKQFSNFFSPFSYWLFLLLLSVSDLITTKQCPIINGPESARYQIVHTIHV